MDKLKLNKIDKPAFTIIEVVLVLAIAGLIFLMVFIALPALQRNQRDTQRKNDMSRVVSALTSYRANNRGKLPTNGYIGTGGTSASQLLTKYLRLDGVRLAISLPSLSQRSSVFTDTPNNSENCFGLYIVVTS